MTLVAPQGFAHRLKAEAYARGAMLAGVARLGPMETARAYDDWIAHGYAGEMAYLERGAEKRRDSTLPVPGAVSALVIGVNYGGREPDGPVARYARGDDYHDVLVPMLRSLQDWISAELGVPVPGKAYTDTGADPGAGPGATGGAWLVRQEHHADLAAAWVILLSRGVVAGVGAGGGCTVRE